MMKLKININRLGWLQGTWLSVKRIFESPLKTFVLLAAVFGSLLILLSPPFTGADEEAHFVRAYGISKGVLVMRETPEVSAPKSIRKTIGCFQAKTPEPGIMYRYSYEEYGVSKKTSFSCAVHVPLNESDEEILATSAPGYSPTTYIPQVFVILIGRLLNLPIIFMVYLTRFAVMAAYIFMIALAIRLLPVRKWALAGVALLPHSLMHFTNPGGDYMLLGTVAVFTAVIVRSVYLSKNELLKENSRLLILLAISAFLMALPKGAFPGICFLPLAIFYGGFSFEKKRKAAISLLVFAVAVLWQKIGTELVTYPATSLLNSLLDFPYAFLKTNFVRWVGRDFIYIGDNVGNIPLPNVNRLGTPSVVITLMNILFAIYLFAGYKEELKIKVSQLQLTLFKYAGILITVSVIAGSFFALFAVAQNMQDGSFAIRGVTPRYFYPAFIMLSIIPFVRKFNTNSAKDYSVVVIIGTMIVMATRILVASIQYQWGPF